MAKPNRVRCDEVIAQIIVRTYDEYDRPIGEAVTQPTKIFRAPAPDFWAHVNRLIQAQEQKQAKPGGGLKKKGKADAR